MTAVRFVRDVIGLPMLHALRHDAIVIQGSISLVRYTDLHHVLHGSSLVSACLLRNAKNTLRSPSSPLISCAAATGTLCLLTALCRTARRLLSAAESRFLAICLVTIVRDHVRRLRNTYSVVLAHEIVAISQ